MKNTNNEILLMDVILLLINIYHALNATSQFWSNVASLGVGICIAGIFLNILRHL